MNNASNILTNYQLETRRIIDLEEMLLEAREEQLKHAQLIISSPLMREALRGTGVIQGSEVFKVVTMGSESELREYIDIQPVPVYAFDLNAEDGE